MILWVDAQLPPAIAGWMATTFGVEAQCLRDLGLRDAGDEEVFERGRIAAAVIMTKDSDFLLLLERFGPPPQILWITCGNTSNAYLRDLLSRGFPKARTMFEHGERLVELR